MNTTSVAIINHHAPFGTMAGKEAQDLALIFGSYEQDVTMYFIGDGVYHLARAQHPELINAKDYLKTYEAFAFYDIEKIYACSDSLKQRKISDTANFVTLLTPEQLKEHIKQHQAVFNF